jgi:hypothetical protein
MFTTERGISRFNLEVEDELQAYEDLQNDPMITILDVTKIKLTDKEMLGEGQMTQTDRLIWVVEWEKKVIS